ncbi:TPA: tyrosine-type recombinase/integrase [Legionella pneumophila]|nr:tyrosine-type recombinase/integrase [Legionella pneumophila]HAT9526029.1 tyrosine-type recombinase/integrase [Legionella pneumophila subsp. pneumophila]HAU2156904.1 tyrosine-type recombinase/integrase [Legionella pneumophila]HDV6747054.1 tyrosine-type recombinase/integrase [Legionella pneumophila]
MRTPTKEIVKKISKILRDERPDYIYLRDLFKKIREEFDIVVTTHPKRLPCVPTEEELRQYYNIVWQTRNTKHMVLIRVLLYTGIRVQELVNIKMNDIDFDRCQIRINHGKGNKDRIVPFPDAFKETLILFVHSELANGALYLFESNRKKPFTTRGVRKILAEYATEAGMQQSISPHKLRHFLFTWLKKQGIDDALIQPYSGHETRQSLEIYSKLSLADAQEIYNEKIDKFPI